jgi:hypothetical protein
MQEQKQEFEPEKNPSFGSAYQDKAITAIIAVDLLLLPILLTSGKLDRSLSTVLIFVCISLPAATTYLLMRMSLAPSKQRWQVISAHLPWLSWFLKFFFFTCLYYAAWGFCGIAIYSTIVHISDSASRIFLLAY